MSSIVKMYPNFKPLSLLPEHRDSVALTSDHLGVMIGGKATILTGVDEGKEAEDTVKMNQVVKIVPAIPLVTRKYTILVSYNPKLAEFGSVSCPAILPPGEEISLTIKAYKNFELAEFTDLYTFIIYAID